MFIEVIPTGAAIGAEIRGVNLAHPLDDATFAKVEEAYNTYGVIFFRNQRLTPPQQVALQCGAAHGPFPLQQGRVPRASVDNAGIWL
jgi:alpha-ketoglutarate-dependent taurine dioxygenase